MSAFLSFHNARKYVISLGLKTWREYIDFCKTEKRPTNIPFHPEREYRKTGWVNMYDFIGITKEESIAYVKAKVRKKKRYLSFEGAKVYVHKLKIKNETNWKEYCKSGNKSNNIPASPKKVYSNEWVSLGDWLGNGKISSQKREYLPFEEARDFVIKLNLKSSQEWYQYSKNNRPNNIPGDPKNVYKNNGWVSFTNWITGKDKIEILDYNSAKEYIKTLNIKGEYGWREYRNSGNKPSNIPSSPDKVYKDKGWLNWGKFLGTNQISNKEKKSLFLSFEEGRIFVRSLNLKNTDEWIKYCKSSNKPNDIPSYPVGVYKNKGWLSMKDWLGVKIGYDGKYLNFEEAKEFAIKLNLKNQNEWAIYCASGNKPVNIPPHPHLIYKDKGWLSMGDWLGTGTIADRNKVFLPFEEAKKFIQSLNLKSQKEWIEYCKSGNKPDNIPSNPESHYRNKK